MRSILAARLLCLGVAAVACGCTSTEPRAAVGLMGNFGSISVNWVGVTLREAGGVVSGYGWSLGKLKQGGTVTGTYQPPSVRFDLVPHQGGETWRFIGTFERDTLRGDYALVPFEASIIEFSRIDTVPTGEYTLHLTGDISADFVGTPTFTSLPATDGFAVELESAGPPLYRVVFFWESRDRPPAGVYPLSFGPGASPLAGVYRYDGSQPNFVQLPPRSGTLTLEVSTRRAMIGRFDLTVTDPATGGLVTARGSFSAGCIGNTC